MEQQQASRVSVQTAAKPGSARPLAAGDVLRDNDPRTSFEAGGRTRYRLVEVVGFDTVHGAQKAVCKTSAGPKVTVSLARIYLDERPRTTGFTRVSP